MKWYILGWWYCDFGDDGCICQLAREFFRIYFLVYQETVVNFEDNIGWKICVENFNQTVATS